MLQKLNQRSSSVGQGTSTQLSQNPINYEDVSSDTDTIASGMQSTYYYLAGVLGLLKFLCPNRDRPGVFVGTYLLLAGWPESHIGQVTFIRSMISLFLQTPSGDLIDKTTKKREVVALAVTGVSLSGLSTVYFRAYWPVAIAMFIQGIALTLIAPAMYGLTLGLVGSERMAQQTSINEMCDHAGTVIFATFAGLLAYFYDDTIIFWVVFIMSLQTIGCLFMIRPHMIDHDRARGLASEDIAQMSTKEGSQSYAPTSYWDILRDKNIIVLLTTVLLFHFSNAAMLPLLSQTLAIGNGRAGIPFTAACIVISQATMVPTASWIGKNVGRFGTKRIFLYGLSLLPFRGTFILILMATYPNRGLLLTTQILDGLASGCYAVMCVLITEDLTRGTGRFNFVFGLVNTMHATGDAFSNLCAQQVAYEAGYPAAFVMLSVMGIAPIFLYAFAMSPKPSHTDSSSTHLSPDSSGGREREKDRETTIQLSPITRTHTSKPEPTVVSKSGMSGGAGSTSNPLHRQILV
mmetsp:Transcript_39987/g.40791  ORF Transcript_39987/g.40791 Transcript_39987/m.40791 type:complete len:518 (-) Transcript_39987:267-1820(-)|eukprot:CAMPEP_0182430310 /NCGR_PEP_ID=MMETSP1167-20130531/39297_1 /TAXON_ID=2988 /ORGANISM="Mallomonas Sp, Strain CCMP3275" /LENGTH=517 /DNA_ID=CAMNT_0024615251 /DNA_START=46 /DNA_END=1599 /DNA_ORIENTATION=+